MNDYVAIRQDVAADHRFECDRLVDSAGKLRIALSDDAGRKVLVQFDSYLSYRRMDEGDALITVEQLERSSSTAKVFYQVRESDFLAWFHAQSRGIYSDRSLQHFAIYTTNDIIDVIALEAPRISVGV